MSKRKRGGSRGSSRPVPTTGMEILATIFMLAGGFAIGGMMMMAARDMGRDDAEADHEAYQKQLEPEPEREWWEPIDPETRVHTGPGLTNKP